MSDNQNPLYDSLIRGLLACTRRSMSIQAHLWLDHGDGKKKGNSSQTFLSPQLPRDLAFEEFLWAVAEQKRTRHTHAPTLQQGWKSLQGVEEHRKTQTFNYYFSDRALEAWSSNVESVSTERTHRRANPLHKSEWLPAPRERSTRRS
mgnify:FL=1